MTTVYRTVLSDQITPEQPPEQAARRWVDNLLMHLQLDGFGIGSPPHDISHNSSKCKLPCSVYGCIFLPPVIVPGLQIPHTCSKSSHYLINVCHFCFVS